jgi:hypothetical protein
MGNCTSKSSVTFVPAVQVEAMPETQIAYREPSPTGEAEGMFVLSRW